jgi:endonuclease YncB( thermonuclease family)
LPVLVIAFAAASAQKSGWFVSAEPDAASSGRSEVEGPAANDWQAPANLPMPVAILPDAVPTSVGGGAAATDGLSARFGYCSEGGGRNCVIDGDTFWFAGTKIRIADVDAPEVSAPRCVEEATRAAAATRRLHDLLNAGPFSLVSASDGTDRYGRALRIVTRNGESLGAALVDEGLARWYAGGRRPWC